MVAEAGCILQTVKEAAATRDLFLPVSIGAGGTVTLDFNRAQNLPCAFTVFATCPVAPEHNRLTVAVEAGEKRPS